MASNIILTDWQTHQTDLIKIRTDVFIREQQVPEADEWDTFDASATHFLVCTDNNIAIGCARLLTEPRPQGDAVYHIGRVALLKPFRNQGIGHQLIRTILDYCQQQAPQREVYLHAQTARRTFYQYLGFTARGTEFMDAGIPHISMWLEPQKY